jgi:hypothetical protein
MPFDVPFICAPKEHSDRPNGFAFNLYELSVSEA